MSQPTTPPTRTYDRVPARRVAFIGLGVMGHPMAGHLARAGHATTVYNRSAAKAAAWVAEYGGAAAPTPRSTPATVARVSSWSRLRTALPTYRPNLERCE